MKKVMKKIIFATIIVMLVHMVIAAYTLYRTPFTSFPWWSAIYYDMIFFAPIFFFEGILLIIMCIKSKE